MCPWRRRTSTEHYRVYRQLFNNDTKVIPQTHIRSGWVGSIYEFVREIVISRHVSVLLLLAVKRKKPQTMIMEKE